MNKTEQNKIEKKLIEEINNNTVSSDAYKKAMGALLAFQKQQEEIRKNQKQEEIDTTKTDIERQKIESQETVAKCQRDLEEQKLQQEKELADQNEKLERMKADLQRRIERQSRINNILTAIIGVFGSIGGTVVSYKMFDKMTTKAYKFEETGSISSFTSKQVMSGLKPPRK